MRGACLEIPGFRLIPSEGKRKEGHAADMEIVVWEDDYRSEEVVENTRFELVTSCMPCKRSSQLS